MELATKDSERAKGFYGEIFGWKFRQDDLPEGGFYIMASAGEKGVCGMYDMPAEMEEHGIPPFWLSYVRVEDLEATVARVGELGGQVMRPPMDVMDYGRMAVCADPTGAAFALWQAGTHTGADAGDMAPGTRCWNELVSTDVEKSSPFFAGLFGWEASPMDMGGEPYTVFKQGEKMVAGLMAKQDEFGPMPSSWVAYLIVPDCDGAIKKAEAMGGKALFPAFDIPDIGRNTWLMDPDGAVFGVLQPAG